MSVWPENSHLSHGLHNKYVNTSEYAYIHAIGCVDRYGYDCLYMHMFTRIIARSTVS